MTINKDWFSYESLVTVEHCASIGKERGHWAWWLPSSHHRRLRPEGLEFKSSLGHIARPCLTEEGRETEGRKKGDNEKDLCILMKKEHQDTIMRVVVIKAKWSWHDGSADKGTKLLPGHPWDPQSRRKKLLPTDCPLTTDRKSVV